MRKLLLTIFLALGFVAPAAADWTGKDASGSTVTFSNPNTCTSVVCVPTAQLVNASGATLLGTAGTANAGVLTVQGIASMTPLLASQSGTWNITNVSGTVSLPTGAATAAKQPALGTAGSASTDVLSVQGIASMTPLLVNPGTAANWGVGTSTQNSATVANGQLALAQFNTSPTTITTGNMSPLQMDSGGNLLATIKAASGSIAANAIASGAFASGAVSSGAFASGAVSSGAYASGSLSSGAVVDITNFTIATGSAPPSKAAYLGANASGATGGQVRGLINCDNHTFKHITSATDTLAVQGVASQTVYICSWRARAAGVATWFLENTASTNANCSSTLTQLTGVATEAANTGETWGNNFWSGLKNTSGNGLCINSTGTGGVDVDIWYTQF